MSGPVFIIQCRFLKIIKLRTATVIIHTVANQMIHCVFFESEKSELEALEV